jgi:hypothetical protein
MPQLSGGQLPLDSIFAKSQLDQLVADAWLQSEWEWGRGLQRQLLLVMARLVVVSKALLWSVLQLC